MEIAPDFFSYFEATASLLDTDKWVFAVCSFCTIFNCSSKHALNFCDFIIAKVKEKSASQILGLQYLPRKLIIWEAECNFSFNSCLSVGTNKPIIPNCWFLYWSSDVFVGFYRTLLAVSSWNDNGQDRFVSDPGESFQQCPARRKLDTHHCDIPA